MPASRAGFADYRHPYESLALALAYGDRADADTSAAGCFGRGGHTGMIGRMANRTSSSARQLHPCACGCGELVPGQWKRGHSARGVGGGVKLAPLPAPGTDGPDGDDGPPIDLGDATPDREGPPAGQVPAGYVPDQDQEPGEAGQDAPAARIGRAAAGRAPRRITAAVRGDIEGKLGIMLEMPGRVWAVRDPLCGGAFLEQSPQIRAAAVDLILMSPDLVAWFTGVGGGFMAWFNLAAACWPVLMVIYAHHIAHSLEAPEGQQQPAAQYAA